MGSNPPTPMNGDRRLGVRGPKKYPHFYAPTHPLAYADGMVYCHLAVCLEKYGRGPHDDENVHHMDGDVWNWEPTNLRLVKVWVHQVAHAFLDGRIGSQYHDVICDECGEVFVGGPKHSRYCNAACFGRAGRRWEYPEDPSDVIAAIQSRGYVGAGRKYGVSDNAIRKYLRRRGIDYKHIRKQRASETFSG